MRVTSILDVGATPSIGALMGSVSNTAVLDRINQGWGGNGSVIFADPTNPIANRYSAFMNAVTNVNNGTIDKIAFTRDYILSGDTFKPIVTEEHLNFVPDCMKGAILMYEPVKQLHQDGRINGWDIAPDTIPTEDFWGRLINNGRVQDVQSTGENEQYLEWEWTTDDPDYTFDQLDALDETRVFFDSFLEEQLGPGGMRRDPTDYMTGGLIGKLMEDM